MKRLLRKTTNQEAGTLQQLKNLLNQQLPSDPKADMNSYEDFLLVVGIGHVITAAMELLEMSSIEQAPANFIPPNADNMSPATNKVILDEFIKVFLQRFINLHLLTESGNDHQHMKEKEYDGIFDYAREVLTLSMLCAVFQDSIHEGDGSRVLSCWKFFYSFLNHPDG